MLIIVAGNDTMGLGKAVRESELMKLHSFLNEKRIIDKWPDDYPLMVDSGAHSWNKETTTKIGIKRNSKLRPAEEFIKEYYDYIKANNEKKVVWVEFDVYGHLPEKLIDRYASEIEEMNLTGEFMRVYHPLIDNGSLRALKEWVEQGHRYIGIGNDSSHLLDEIFSITRDKVKVHGFAMTKLDLMERYPFFSVDSTSPCSTMIFGTYSVPIMSFKDKQDVFNEKSIECFDSTYEKLEKAVIETRKTQDYITEVWRKKGIQWENLKL